MHTNITMEEKTELLNPYATEKLSPKHLELLYPAVFYKSDEELSLHLSRKSYESQGMLYG